MKMNILIYCINVNFSIDNLTLPIEAVRAEEQEKQGYVIRPETITDNVPLETIKVLKIFAKEPLKILRNQNGIPIVSNYF